MVARRLAKRRDVTAMLVALEKGGRLIVAHPMPTESGGPILAPGADMTEHAARMGTALVTHLRRGHLVVVLEGGQAVKKAVQIEPPARDVVVASKEEQQSAEVPVRRRRAKGG